MITRTEDRHAKRVEAVDNSKRKVVLNPSKAWRRRRTTQIMKKEIKDVLKFTIHLSVMGSIALLITYLMKL